MVPATLGVIGLGGIGGSVALRAARYGIPTILGCDDDTRDGVRAVRAGAVTELAHDPGMVLRRCEFVVLAVPAHEGVRLLEAHSDVLLGGDTLCTDLADLKRPVASAAGRLGLDAHFAGSHPVILGAGGGFGSIPSERLDGALVYVTPVGTGERTAAEVADFWTRVVGAHPVITTPERHDEIVAWTEGLPAAAAAAVSLALARNGPSGVTVGPTMLAVTEPALRHPDRSARALLTNRENVLRVLGALRESAVALATALDDGDEHAVREWLEEARRWRERQKR